MFHKKSIIFNLLIILFLGSFFSFSCKSKPKNLKIAVSWVSVEKDSSNYIKWLRKFDPLAEYIVMSQISPDSLDLLLKECSGLLLTGGEDVYPGRYGQEADTTRCTDINLKRDTLEFYLIKNALHRKLPVLGICRGQQIFNVALGGTLYVDIPTEIDTRILHQCEDYTKCFHNVKVLSNNLLTELSGIENEMVTTNHHQAVNKIADELKVLAVSEDGIIESLGWEKTNGNPFLITVQWHPERMDTANRLSAPLAKAFLDAAKSR